MSSNANSAYPLLVNYKEEPAQKGERTRGVLIEYDPATGKESEDAYVSSAQTVPSPEWLNLKRFNIGKSIEYGMDFVDEDETRETQRISESEWISVTGEVRGKKSRKSTFSFFGSPRTTSELEITICIATSDSIEEYLDLVQAVGINTDTDALRQRLQGKGFYRFQAIKEQEGDDGYLSLSFEETFGLVFYILPEHYETIKKAFVEGSLVRAGINLYFLHGVFLPQRLEREVDLPESVNYKILDDLNDIHNRPPEDMFAMQSCSPLSVGFEFSFSISSKARGKRGRR